MYFDELYKGQSLRLETAKVDREEMLVFAKRYDDVPLHTDAAYAAQTRFGRLLAPGMLSFLLVWRRYLERDFFGEELIAGLSQNVCWHAPVFADDELTGVATVTALTVRNARNGVVQLTIEVQNQDGTHVLTGVTEALVKRKPSK